MQYTQELNRIKNRVGLLSGRLKINEYDDAQENISAKINTRNWEIEITLRTGYEPIQDEAQADYAQAKGITDGKLTVLEDVLYHELAHWEVPYGSGFGCPYDVYHHDLILEAVKKALPKDKEHHASYVTNVFEDMIINPRCKEFKGDFSGLVLFWDNEGLEGKAKGRQFYSSFYEAFVKLNMHLFGDEKDTELLKRHYSDDKTIDTAVAQVVKQLNLPQNIGDTSVLFEKKRWPQMAAILAKNLAALLDATPQERLSAFSSDGEDSEQSSGNGIEQKASSRAGREEIAYGRYTHNNGLSPQIDTDEQLDALYRRLAQAIPVNVEAMTRKQSLVIGPLNFRPFDPETDDPAKINPRQIYVRDGSVTFGYQRQPLVVPQRSKIQVRSFPDFKLVILDNSGSMAYNVTNENFPRKPVNVGNTAYIPWGDKSKYHFALLGVYGIEEFLQAQGIAQHISHGLSLFSSSTRYEESGFSDLQKLRRLALSPKFDGETKIDANVLLRALRGKESFVVSISDGEIANWESAKPEFETLARENYFAHIQIGAQNNFTSDLEAAGFRVLYAQSGEELSKLMVSVATTTYRQFTVK